MKFVADVMLGRLAKRLRLLGHDVLYDRTIDDNAVIRISVEQNRIILTRDTALAKRPLAANHLLIQGDEIDSQLEQVLAVLARNESVGNIPLPLTRCSSCNSPLASVPRNEIRDLVPAYVFEQHRRFHRCPGCGRVYWAGTHTKKMGLRRNLKQGKKAR